MGSRLGDRVVARGNATDGAVGPYSDAALKAWTASAFATASTMAQSDEEDDDPWQRCREANYAWSGQVDWSRFA